MSKKLRIGIIAACLMAAAFFLFFRLGKGDPVTDEVELAFRAIGYMDFLATPFQTTPLEWFAEVPWWTKLTFHDHPPVIFVLGYSVFQMFGDSLIALRVPFAVLGLGSLLLIYLISRKLFGQVPALLALALGITNTYLTWIGRIGLQEELVIFFTLLCLWFLIKAEQNRIYFIFWGVGLGLGLLSKYTAGIILPISIVYLLYFHRGGLKNKFFNFGFLIAFLIFSPILIFNIAMYRAVGHFDLQFSSFLGQDVSAHWQSLPGKDIGSLGQRILSFYPNLWRNDLILAILSIVSSIYLLYEYSRGRLQSAGKFLFWVLVLYHLLIIVIGPSQRFLVILAPWVVMTSAYTLNKLFTRRAWFAASLAVILVWQGFYNYGTNLTYATNLGSNWSFSKLRFESAAYGYNELEAYLHQLLDTKKPVASLGLPVKLEFIENYRKQDYRGIANHSKAPHLIIYDPRIDQVAKLWLLDRRYYYDGWPIMSVDEFLQVQQIAPEYFKSLGLKEYFYIATTPDTFSGGTIVPGTKAAEFEQNFTGPEQEILSPEGKTVFRIYHNSL